MKNRSCFRCLIVVFFITIVNVVKAQEVQPYQIFTKTGKKVSYKNMLAELEDTQVVLFGELHNNSIAHYLQLKLAKSLSKIQTKTLVIGAEMFERDQAEVLQLYTNGSIDEEQFKKNIRLWQNYSTDYKPLLDFAKSNNIKYVATNIPRRYASLLYKKGIEALDTLSVIEKSWLTPLPFPYDKNLPGYVKMMEMFKDTNHSNENFPKSQAIKDATMAHFILANLQEDAILLHLNGSYHSDFYEGIFWYLKVYNDKVRVKTLTVVEQSNVKSVEKQHLNKADYIIVTDGDFPKSY